MRAKLSDGSSWPAPCDELAWRMRYKKNRTDEDCLRAAEIIEAYRLLVHLPRNRRDAVLSEIKVHDTAGPTETIREELLAIMERMLNLPKESKVDMAISCVNQAASWLLRRC